MRNKFNSIMDTDESINELVQEDGYQSTMDHCFNSAMKKLINVRLYNDAQSARDAAWYFNKYAELYEKSKNSK